MVPAYRSQEEVSEAIAKLQAGEQLEMDENLQSPDDGVLVHGLFLEASRWDNEKMVLGDAKLGEMTSVSNADLYIFVKYLGEKN